MLQLKDIINYLDWLDNVIIYQGDAYIKPEEQEDPWEEVFKGGVMDIPWYYLNYYLTNDKSTMLKAINSCFDRDKNEPYMELFLCEQKEYTEKYEKGEIKCGGGGLE